MPYSTSIGLDVHARSISACALIWETGEVISREFGYEPEKVAGWARSLPQPAGCLYESGPCGFDLKRKLDALDVPCHVGAVTKMVRPAGDRVKTDRRDARFLAGLLLVGEYVECQMPTEAMEAARDLSRAREDVRQDLMRARHQLSKLLLRYGFVWPKEKATWTHEHRKWLRSVKLSDPTAQLVLEDYIEKVKECEERRSRLDAAIARRAKEPDLAPTVKKLECIRGISLVTAFGLASEIGDFERFSTARGFMSYVGLVPSESSSGESVSRGSITKTGNTHVRRLLVESAWHHARAYSPATESLRVPPDVTAETAHIANKANRRLHERSVYLREHGKRPNVANVAVARELAGFVWALARAE